MIAVYVQLNHQWHMILLNYCLMLIFKLKVYHLFLPEPSNEISKQQLSGPVISKQPTVLKAHLGHVTFVLTKATTYLTANYQAYSHITFKYT